MNTKLFADSNKLIDLGNFLPGLKLRLEPWHSGQNFVAKIYNDKQEVGSSWISVLPKMLELGRCDISMSLSRPGIGTAFLRYLRAYAAEAGKSWVTLSTASYDLLYLLQTDLFRDTYVRSSYFGRWIPLTAGNILRENRWLHAVCDDIRIMSLKKNLFSRWESRAPYTLHIDSANRIWLTDNDNPEGMLPDVKFYLTRFYEVRLSAVREPS